MSRKDSIDTLAGLLNVLSNPEANKKKLAELDAKIEVHREAIKQHGQAKKDAENHIETAKKLLAESDAEHSKLRTEHDKFEQERRAYIENVDTHLQAVKIHENAVKEFKSLQAETDKKQVQARKQHDDYVAEQLKKLDSFQNELLRRDKAVSVREELVAEREADLREIQEQARQLAARTTRR